jgi:hypothetical protein
MQVIPYPAPRKKRTLDDFKYLLAARVYSSLQLSSRHGMPIPVSITEQVLSLSYSSYAGQDADQGHFSRHWPLWI